MRLLLICGETTIPHMILYSKKNETDGRVKVYMSIENIPPTHTVFSYSFIQAKVYVVVAHMYYFYWFIQHRENIAS